MSSVTFSFPSAITVSGPIAATDFNGVSFNPLSQSTLSGTFIAPVNDNFHYFQMSPVITSAGSSTDMRALSIDIDLTGVVDAAAVRSVRLRAMTAPNSPANVATLQGISSSQTHQGFGTVGLMNAYQGSMNLWGSGNATLVEYYRANTPNFISAGIITGPTKGLAVYDIGSTGASSVYGGWVDDFIKPTNGSAFGYWTQMAAGAGGKYAFYGAGSAPSVLGGSLTVSGSQNVFGLPSSANALTSNSSMTFELTSNTSLKIFARGTDGITRSSTLTLS